MISIIIPSLNEADFIASSLNALMEQQGGFEVVVSDGGSEDGTLEIVKGFPAVRCVEGARGRASQMNAGAVLAKGEILLFLHADTRLPPNGLELIRSAFSSGEIIGGSFCLGFDRQTPLLRAICFFSRINHMLFTYGDQGLFVRRRTFERIGGFRDIPIMEDIEIQQRLRNMGGFLKIRTPVVSAARRFITHGVARQQIRNTILVFLYHLGVPPSRLKRFYRDPALR